MYGKQLYQAEETGKIFSLGIPGVSYGGHFIHTLSTATWCPEEGMVNSLSPRLWGTWHDGAHVKSTQSLNSGLFPLPTPIHTQQFDM